MNTYSSVIRAAASTESYRQSMAESYWGWVTMGGVHYRDFWLRRLGFEGATHLYLKDLITQEQLEWVIGLLVRTPGVEE